jgi:hypothetical protein
VSARIGAAHRDLVAFCDQLLDGDAQIRDAGKVHRPLLLGSRQAGRLPWQGSVVEVVRRDEFVSALHLPLVEDRRAWTAGWAGQAALAAVGGFFLGFLVGFLIAG